MNDDRRYGTVLMRKRFQRWLFAATLICAGGLQGCATSLETFGLGAGVGIVGALGALGCAIGCR
ncbi:hypothetical protein [Paraburkholderia fynbosensis]|uniref:Lipoprotein n=1 Tax=Paraburkholderia fynbosensis TaxID=1200993 RepID=A0A6J5FR13_9BURK|nr:hypothetical protein [Paraburkholderia fynbosensis]CAB3785488.1 hypothetical protein LMG27177_01856 [Paraburkholderia fynbosensis]